ncbi:MAG: hypothetical protein KJ646_03205 [Nanoarchaeota archaeon]|nr:hypothetical protein [Nanoarchaeota archaeon]MBU4116780.1 hypothetical protein [Nanoarchaeota archaeon]
MADVIASIGTKLISIYNSFILTLPQWAQHFIALFLLVLLIVVYSIFIWKLYRFVAKKNIFELNLNQYNKSEHPGLAKFLASIFYLLEYIIVLPFLIFFWFAIFTTFLIFLTENLEIQNLLIISATIIAAIRMTSYYNENLSKDLAKLLPFTLLAVSVLSPDFFNIERILSHFSRIPEFLNQIIIYLLFIVILEIVLRFFEFVFSLFDLGEKVEEEVVEE